MTELETSDDAATVNWGNDWRIPNKAQCEELRSSSYTTTTKTTRNGVYGLLVTSKVEGYTDKSIFLPAAGDRDYGYLDYAGRDGNYWSRSLCTSDPKSAYILDFSANEGYTSVSTFGRSGGVSVRPVRVIK